MRDSRSETYGGSSRGIGDAHLTTSGWVSTVVGIEGVAGCTPRTIEGLPVGRSRMGGERVVGRPSEWLWGGRYGYPGYRRVLVRSLRRGMISGTPSYIQISTSDTVVTSSFGGPQAHDRLITKSADYGE